MAGVPADVGVRVIEADHQVRVSHRGQEVIEVLTAMSAHPRVRMTEAGSGQASDRGTQFQQALEGGSGAVRLGQRLDQLRGWGDLHDLAQDRPRHLPLGCRLSSPTPHPDDRTDKAVATAIDISILPENRGIGETSWGSGTTLARAHNKRLVQR